MCNGLGKRTTKTCWETKMKKVLWKLFIEVYVPILVLGLIWLVCWWILI